MKKDGRPKQKNGKPKKCYVIMVSRVFPTDHPKVGTITGFIPKIEQGEKQHTIRGNYDFWKKRIDKVIAGEAYISLRFWIGKPYRSAQHEFLQLEKAGIQKIEIDYNGAEEIISQINGGAYGVGLRTVAANDGLKFTDFLDWFFPGRHKQHTRFNFTGAIIHFNTILKY
uniref:hypothetical protein n=1 Tax=uncultured Draconibacterium sp. TaxID=1573823 RepID=UPI003217553F